MRTSLLRVYLAACIMLAAAPTAFALGKLQGIAQRGGETVLNSVVGSTIKASKTYPLASVEIRLTGTLTKAALVNCTDLVTVVTNPVTANSKAEWSACTVDGDYDAYITPAGDPGAAWTVSRLRVGDGGTSGTIEGFTVVRSTETQSYGTVEGARTSTTHFFSTNLSSYDDCAIDVNVLSRYLPVTSVTITNGGAGYTSGATVTFGASPIGNTATGTVTVVANVVTAIVVTNGGAYPSNAVPSVTISPIGAGSGALGTAVLRSFIRTGIHSKIFTNPDNGGESSGMLVVQTGGGSGLTAYKFTELRPAGYEDYADSAQGAAEIMTSGSSFAIYAVAGAGPIQSNPLTTKKSTAILATVNNAGSRGVVCSMSDLVWDTRDCFVVGSHQSNAAPVNVHWRVQANGNMSSSGTIAERDRGPMGEWTTPTYSGATYDAGGAQTWTVDSGDVVTFEYALIGKTMMLSFFLSGTSVGGTPNSDLRIVIPGGFTATKTVITTMTYVDAGGAETTGTVRTGAGTVRLLLRKIAAANWSAAANNTTVYGQIFFEIN